MVATGQRTMKQNGKRAAMIAVRFGAAIAFGLMLAACTKCDVPSWKRGSNDGAPVACHDDAPLSQ
jgi:hypothetical protein